MACGSPSLGVGGTLGRRIGARCHSKCRSFGTCFGPISSHSFADQSRRMGLLLTCWLVCPFIFAPFVDVASNFHVRTCLHARIRHCYEVVISMKKVPIQFKAHISSHFLICQFLKAIKRFYTCIYVDSRKDTVERIWPEI